MLNSKVDLGDYQSTNFVDRSPLVSGLPTGSSNNAGGRGGDDGFV